MKLFQAVDAGIWHRAVHTKLEQMKDDSHHLCGYPICMVAIQFYWTSESFSFLAVLVYMDRSKEKLDKSIAKPVIDLKLFLKYQILKL